MLLTSSWLADSAILFIASFLLLYKYFTRNFDHWKQRGITGFKPVPFFGNFYDTITFKKNIAEGLRTLYQQTDADYFGIFAFDTPVLVIKSPELIKTVLIKDFTYFNDRSFASPDHNPLFSNFLLFQRYNKWKDTRAKIRPIFASTKLKLMFPTVTQVIKEFHEHIRNNLKTHSSKYLSERFATELIIRCFFGVDGKCLDPGESSILQMSRRVSNSSFRNAIIQLLYQFKPELVDMFKLDFIGKYEQNYLVDVLRKCMENRKTADKIRDYVDIVMKERDSSSNYTKEDLMAAMANSVESFMAGTDTISSILSFTLYHLAMEPRIQDKLRQEIKGVLDKHGDFTFESLQEMEYGEMCINETARKYVTLQFIDRRAVKDYKLPDGFVIEKGTVIYIPSFSLHMDEKYFPQPDKYIPERFLNNSMNENGLFYMPFGGGPRMCIAAQFSKVVLKATLAHILTTFEVKKCEGTPRKIKCNPRSLTMQSIDDIPLQFELLSRN